MSDEPIVQPTRYFWSGWITTPSIGQLEMVFLLLSLADLSATIKMMMEGLIREGNQLAATVLHFHGIYGLIAYKMTLVLIVITTTWIVSRQKPELATKVLWGAILLMGVIGLKQISVLVYYLYD
ncbi:MAG: DUF5658 family protein [Armatimonadota bacterium]